MLRKVMIVVVVVLVVILIAIMGCGQEPTIVTRHHGMDLIPGDAHGGMYLDFKSMREDKDLSAVYEGMAVGQFEWGEEIVGVSASQVDFMVSYGAGVVFGGSFNDDKVREALGELEFEEGTYEDAELWTGYHGELGEGAVAILKGGLIYGEPDTVKRHMRVINGTEASLYQAEDIEQVMDRLPGWSPIMLMLQCELPEQMGFSDALALAMAFSKADKDNLKLAVIIEFESESAATEGLTGAETFVRSMEGIEIEVSRSGTYVEIEAKIPLQVFSQ